VKKACAAILAALLAACSQPPPNGPVATSAPPPPPPVPLDQAVLTAGDAVFSAAVTAVGPRTVVIDPLVNGVTGEQSASTKALATRLTELARQRYPQMRVEPFTPAAVSAAPLVMVGTFTPVDAHNQAVGPRDQYRFCLVLADLAAGKIVAKRAVFATPDGIDGTPTRAFADAPTWTEDPSIKSYVATCQATKVGDPIPQAYLNGIITASIVAQAMDAYDAGRYREALGLYDNARSTPAGDQLRVYNGLYLAESKLGERDQAAAAFGQLVDYGLRANRLAVKLLFRPASTAFVADPQVSGAYDMWLRQIADRTARSTACLEVTGHTSASGSPSLNERLSVLRAEYVKTRLEQDAPALHGHVVAAGAGDKQPLVGTGADNASDALDRRVEFKVIPSCT